MPNLDTVAAEHHQVNARLFVGRGKVQLMAKYEEKNDYYAKLGVDANAATDEIARAYRARAKLVHPDGHRVPDLASEEMKALNVAYEVLIDPARRRMYDEERAAHRLREQQAVIQRRVAQEVAKELAKRGEPTRAQTRSAQANRYGRKRADDLQSRLNDVRRRAEATRERVGRHHSKSPSALVPQAQRGAFIRLAEPKVRELYRDGRAWEATLIGVGAAMLDAWLQTPTPRRQ